jgi:DNA-binding MarR family transcriptional regulator
MDMSGGLYTLPSEALAVLRFFAQSGSEIAHVEAITEGTGLSDRGFGKGLRRLVTRNYLTLSDEYNYRLTEQGRRAVRELLQSGDFGDADAGSPGDPDDARFVRRRLVLVTPSALAAEQPTRVVIGFDDPDDEDRLSMPCGVLLRLNMVHGEPARSLEVPLNLDNSFAQYEFEITAGAFTQARLRAEVFQFKASDEDFEFCGGMYLDLPVHSQPTPAALAPRAHGVDVILRDPGT